MHVGHKLLLSCRNICMNISNCFGITTVGGEKYVGITLGFILLSEVRLA